MARTFVVPLDGSEAAEQALPLAERLARQVGATLHLVTVLDPAARPGTDSPDTAADLEREERHLAEECVERAAEAARTAHGLSARPGVLTGPPATALAQYARSHGADLIVMTTHGRGGLSRWWLGSVADRLLRRATVPVLLLPLRTHPQPTEFHRILVAQSGEPGDDAVLERALALATPVSGAALRLVRVVPESAPVLSPLGAYPTQGGPDWATRQSLEARTALARTARRVGGRGGKVTTEVIAAASVAETILRAADAMAADLVAVGTHGAGAVERLILGSVADKVIRGAGRPVLVVPVTA